MLTKSIETLKTYLISVQKYENGKYITSKSIQLYENAEMEWLLEKIAAFLSSLVVEVQNTGKQSGSTVKIDVEDLIIDDEGSTPMTSEEAAKTIEQG